MIPFHIETLYQHKPWANWALIGATVLTSLMLQSGLLTVDETTQWFTLGKGGPPALLGHLLAHESWAGLIGNMLFLWVFGNAVCGIIGNLPFLALYLALGSVSGLVQLAIGGAPVAGSSGAIAGLLGVALAFFPVNNVSLYYPHWLTLRTRSAPVWILSLYWIVWAGIGAWCHLGPSATWGQLGGATVGVGFGLAMLTAGFVQLTEFDNGSLFDLYRNRHVPAADRAAAETRTELRQLARSYFEEYSALPTIRVGAVTTGRQRPRLTLRGSVAFAQSAATPATTAVRAATKPAAPTRMIGPAAGSASRLSAWPTDLPDVPYFCFDGEIRNGPMPRAKFLAMLSLAADTSRWWYWTNGMQGWQRVSLLERTSTQSGPSGRTGNTIGPAAPHPSTFGAARR